MSEARVETRHLVARRPHTRLFRPNRVLGSSTGISDLECWSVALDWRGKLRAGRLRCAERVDHGLPMHAMYGDAARHRLR